MEKRKKRWKKMKNHFTPRFTAGNYPPFTHHFTAFYSPFIHSPSFSSYDTVKGVKRARRINFG
jgi:hypothetical protein